MGLRRYPKSPQILLSLGRFYFRFKKYDKAQKTLQRALCLEPNSKETLYFYSLLHREQGKNKKALEFIEKCLREDARNIKALRLQSYILQDLGKQKQAQKSLKRASLLVEKQLKDRLEKIKQEKREEIALVKWEALLSDYPEYEEGFISRALLYEKRKEYEKALKDISHALNINPCARYYLLKGKWLLKCGYFKEADQNLKQALDLTFASEKKQEILYWFAEAKWKLGNYKKAYQYYRECFQNRKADHLKLGKAAFRSGDYKNAHKHLKQITSKQHLGEVLYFQGKIQLHLGNFSKARKYLKKALDYQDVDRGKIFFALGTAYKMWAERTQKNSRYKRASLYLQEAVKIIKDNPRIYEMLGHCFFKTRKWKKVVQAFTRCVELESWKSSHYHHRGCGYKEQNEFRSAEKDFLASIQLNPRLLPSVLKLLEVMFQEGILVNYYKFDAVMINLKYLGSKVEIPNLFGREKKKLRERCIQESIRAKRDKRKKEPWGFRQEKKAKVYLKGLIESQITGVHNMAFTGLLDLCLYKQMHAMLNREIAKKHFFRVQKRLLNLKSHVMKKYFEKEKKVHLRRELVQLYSSPEYQAFSIDQSKIFLRKGGYGHTFYARKILAQLYKKGEKGVRELELLLKDEKEHIMIRFMAAKALLDLRDPMAFRFLKKMALEPGIVGLFSNAVLKSQNFRAPNYNSFHKAKNFKNPYARNIAVKYMSLKDRFGLRKFLKDPDLRIRLTAAMRLRKYGDREASQILIQAFQSSSSTICAYAHFAFWDFMEIWNITRSEFKLERLQKEAEVYRKDLEKALQSKDLLLRRVAISRFSLLKNNSKILKASLEKEKDTLTKLQTIMALGRTGNTKLLMSILKNPNEPFLFRTGVILSTINKWYHRRSASRDMMMTLSQLLKDPDPRIRTIVFLVMARLPQMCSMLIASNWNSSDQHTKIGCLVGLLLSPNHQSYRYVKKMLHDSDPIVRHVAATIATFLAERYDPVEAKKIFQYLQQQFPSMRSAGALGYCKFIYTPIPNPNFKGTNINWEKFAQAKIKNLEIFSRKFKIYGKKSSLGRPVLNHYIQCLNRALQLTQKNSRIWLDRAVLYYVNEEYEKSLQDLNEAKRQKPNSYTIKYWLAKTHFANHNSKKAAKIFEEIAEYYLWDSNFWKTFAEILEKAGRKEEACKARKRAELVAK